MSSIRALSLFLVALCLTVLAGSRCFGQVEWTREGEGPVFLPQGDWDAASVGYPHVLKVEGEYRMWFVGASNQPNQPFNGRIGVATSLDGRSWTEYEGNPVLVPGPEAWEGTALQKPSVIGEGSEFKMWYPNISSEPCQIGMATSADGGFTWEKYEGNPVLRTGTIGWEQRCLADEFVLKVGDEYRMWYVGGGSADVTFASWVLGMAASPDGVEWKRYGGNPVLSENTTDQAGGVLGPFLTQDPLTLTYEIWYSVVRAPGGPVAIHYATSMDGIEWSKHPDNPVFVAESDWEQPTVGAPSILFDGITYTMWYYGGTPTTSGIGLATAPWSIPKASFTTTPSRGGENTISVDSSKSAAPPSRTLVERRWDFGDGSDPVVVAGDPIASHTYARPGHYVVLLSVKDSDGMVGFVARGVDAVMTSCTGENSSPVADPWTSSDIGEPVFPGSACLRACGRDLLPGIVISAGGRLLGGIADQFHFVHQPLQGDLVLTARIGDATGAADNWDVGIDLREATPPEGGCCLDSSARHLSMVLGSRSTATNPIRFRSSAREAVGRSSKLRTTDPGSPGNAWVRLERQGDVLIASYSTDGESFQEAQRVTLPGLPETLYGGVAADGDGGKEGSFEALLAQVCEIEISRPSAGVGPFTRGDSNGDGTVDLSDAIHILEYLFLGTSAPSCIAAANANGDAKVDLTDPIGVLGFLFLGESAPAAPYPSCGRGVLDADGKIGCATPPKGCQ